MPTNLHHANTGSDATNASTDARTVAPEIMGNLEAIDQCKQLLELLVDTEYVRLLQPYVQSSIGEHVRHVLDVYHAIMLESSNGIIDYNLKRRGSELETSRAKALAEIDKIQIWLQAITPEQLNRRCTVRSELTLHQQTISDIESFLRRELVFAASHVIHHCALIRICVRLRNLPTDDLFGVAPATASYWRKSGRLGDTVENNG